MKKSRIDALLEKQEGMSKTDRQSIEKMQLEKLNALLKKEKERSGFYKTLPERVCALEELASLPFTTDEDLANNAGKMLLCSQSDICQVLSDATSGTTGTAKRVFYTEGDCEKTVGLFMAGLGELVFPGSVTMICMPFSHTHGLGELIAEAIERLGARALKVGVGKSFGALAEILENEKPDTFVGFPGQLLSMLRFCGVGSLKRALVSGDSCPETVISECERLLDFSLFPHYGSREMALGGAVTCPAHEGMHLRENHVIAEIIDENGNVLPRGRFGELVITTIGMEAMPLIRYKTGDYTRILPKKCPCGSDVLRIDKVSRPETEYLEALDNRLFSLEGLIDYSITEYGEIYALTDNSISERDILNLLEFDAKVHCRKVLPTDKPLYIGKRTTKCSIGNILVKEQY